MDTTVVPVDERTRAEAHWGLYVAVGLPTVSALAAGLALKLLGRTESHAFAGLLTWVVLIGFGQLVVLLVGRMQHLSGVALRADEAARAPKNEPGLFRSRRGGSLMAALIATFVLSVGMLLALQAYYHCSAALARTSNRSRALMALESHAEILRAAGFAALPEPGRHAIPAEALRGLPGATGSLTVKPGPAPRMRTISLEVRWQEGDRPPGRTSLVFGMAEQGMDS
ncbi:MAG: hypothetical protein FJX74_04800 [Armatimonadetes bacterium]|nr:hypothetical protein [Armatimonadota bacterium]